MKHPGWNSEYRYAIDAVKRPEGMRADELNCGESKRYKVLKTMQDQGLIFKGARNHRTFRFFDTAERADQWAKNKGDEFGLVVKRSTKAPWNADTPMVITERTKITKCPSPPDPCHTCTHAEL